MTRLKKTMICPFGGVGLGGKWKIGTWYHLLNGPRRFSELQRLLPQASRQMLTIQLRELEQMGIIRRKVYVQGPPKVEYALTELGRRIEPMLRQVYVWGEWFGEQTGLEFDLPLSMGGRWSFWIWYHLLNGPRRLSELQRLLPGASRQTLIIQLRSLEETGVLQRHVYFQGSLRVEYALTEPGQRSETMLRQMYAWGRWYCEQMGIEYDWPVSDIAVERIS